MTENLVPEPVLSPLMQKLRLSKESAFNWRRRRHEDWSDNYTLYRDKVQLNRLLQRQSVNIPLIKYSIKTLLKDIDDAPLLYFQNLDNNDQAEVYYNEYWKWTSKENKLIVKDIVDKRQVLLFGRSFKSMNFVNGRFDWTVDDPQDILVDRFVDPSRLDSARFIVKEHNYKPLSSLTTNPFWDTKAVKRLQEYFATTHGLIKADANAIDYVEKQKRMASMGVIDVMAPVLGEAYVELNEFFIKEFDNVLHEDVIKYIVTAENMEVLFSAPLEQVIGETQDNYWRSHFPIVTWGDETERTDFWSDGVADTLRTLNKIMNAWFSQMVENRTMRNYGMNYYNSSLGEEGFVPQTFTPEPYGWYPIPVGADGKIQDTVMHVDIPALEDNLEEMNFIKTVAEQASAAVSTAEGVEQKHEVTLGEVKLQLANAQERVKSMAVYYTDCWEEFGLKYIKMLEAAPHHIAPVTIHRHGRLTKKMYTKTISPEDWKTKMGYKVDVQMKSEKMAEDTDALQWLNAARGTMQGNQPLDEIYKKKLLENANCTADEINEILKVDKQMMKDMALQAQSAPPQTEAPSKSMNYKDLPPDGQIQMAKQGDIQIGQAQQPAQMGNGAPGMLGPGPSTQPTQMPVVHN